MVFRRSALLRKLLMGWMLSFAIGCATGADQAKPFLVNEGRCGSIAGEYEFWGTANVDGRDVPISFLQRLSRPSRQGVRSVRIVEGSGVGEFKVSFLDDAGETTGDDVLLVVRCIDGKWEDSNSFEGNSDGTLVKGDRVWNYYLGANDALMVEYAVTATSQYFPGLPSSSPRSARGISRFVRLR